MLIEMHRSDSLAKQPAMQPTLPLAPIPTCAPSPPPPPYSEPQPAANMVPSSPAQLSLHAVCALWPCPTTPMHDSMVGHRPLTSILACVRTSSMGFTSPQMILKNEGALMMSVLPRVSG